MPTLIGPEDTLGFNESSGMEKDDDSEFFVIQASVEAKLVDPKDNDGESFDILSGNEIHMKGA